MYYNLLCLLWFSRIAAEITTDFHYYYEKGKIIHNKNSGWLNLAY